MHSRIRQLAILNPMRLIRVNSQPRFSVGFIRRVISFEPATLLSPSNARMCVAMRSRNQRSWLMIDGAAGEVFQGLFQRADRVHIQIVGRLVEQQHIGALLEHAGQVDAIAFAAGEGADFVCWSVPEKPKRVTKPRQFTETVPSLRISWPSEIACQTD